MNSNTPQKRYYRRLINSGVAPQKVARFNKYLRTLNRSKSTIMPLSSLYRMFDEQTSERARRAPGATGRAAIATAGAMGRGATATVGAMRRGATATVGAMGRGATATVGAMGRGAASVFRREAPRPLPSNFLRYLQDLSREGIMTTTKTERFSKWYQSLPNTRKQIYGTNYAKARENFNRSLGERTGRFFGAYGSKRNLPTTGMNVHRFINSKTSNRNKKLRFLNYYRRLPVNLKNATQLQRVYNNFNKTIGERARRAPGATVGAMGRGATATVGAMGRGATATVGAMRSGATATVGAMGRGATATVGAMGRGATATVGAMGRGAGRIATGASNVRKALGNRFTRQTTYGNNNINAFYGNGNPKSIPIQNFKRYVKDLYVYQTKNKQLANLYKNYEPKYERQKRLRNLITNKSKNLKRRIAERANKARTTIEREAARVREAIGNRATNASRAIRGFVNKGLPLTNSQLGELANYNLNNATQLSFRSYVNGLYARQKVNKNTKALFDEFFARTRRSGISPGKKNEIRRSIGGNNSEKEAFIKHLESIHPRNRNNYKGMYNEISAKNMTKNYIEKVKKSIGFPNNRGNYTLLNSFIRKLKNIPPNKRNTETKIRGLYNARNEFNLAKTALGFEPNNKFKNFLRRTNPNKRNTETKIRGLYNYYGIATNTNPKNKINVNKTINLILAKENGKKIHLQLGTLFKNYARGKIDPKNPETVKNIRNKFYNNKNMREKILTAYGHGPNFTRYWLTNRPNQNISNPNLLNTEYKKHVAASASGSGTSIQKWRNVANPSSSRKRGELLLNVVQAAKEQQNLLSGTENVSNNESNISIGNVPVELPQGQGFSRVRNAMRLRGRGSVPTPPSGRRIPGFFGKFFSR